jgi:AraC family transcriptional regulator
MFGNKKNLEENASARQAALEEQAPHAPIAAAAEQLEKNIYRIPAISYFGKHIRINTKNAKNEDQVRAYWQRCREDGTLDTLRAIAHPDAKCFTAVCTDFQGREYEYWIAVEPADGAEPPSGYERIETIERRCAVFPCEGPAHEAVAGQWHFIYNKWFPRSAYSYDQGPEIENYPFGDMQAADYKCEILVPVKPMEPVKLPRRKDSMMGLLFVAVGAVAGVLVAGSAESPFIFILGGGLLGYFVYAYINKRREEMQKKKEENGEDKK